MSHPRVANVKWQTWEVYVGRPSKWGNPHRVGYCPRCRHPHTRSQAITLYRKYLFNNPDLLLDLRDLQGRRLGCHCAPKPCHADVLARLANLPPLTVVFTGDRHWRSVKPVTRALACLPKGSTIIVGDAKGLDTIAYDLATIMGFTVHRHIADWKQFGRAAGPIRNRAMLKGHRRIDLCFAFHDRIHESKGTRDMMRQAKRAKIKTVLIQNRIWLSLLPHHASRIV